MAYPAPPVCPLCHSQVSLWRLWIRIHQFRGSFFVLQRIGVECPTCGKPLVVIKRWSLLASAALLLGAAGAMLLVLFGYVIGHDVSDMKTYAAIGVAVAPVMALWIWVPARLLRLRVRKEDDNVEMLAV